MTFEDLWTAERRFWLDGSEFYVERMAPEARMIFPPPAGILKSEAILAGLKQGPRWQYVDMDERSETASGDTVVLAYRAKGRRPGAEPYVALCSSTYVKRGAAWKLLFHQQTPVG